MDSVSYTRVCIYVCNNYRRVNDAEIEGEWGIRGVVSERGKDWKDVNSEL